MRYFQIARKAKNGRYPRFFMLCFLALPGCVQTHWQSLGQGSGYPARYAPAQTLHTADQMMDIELTDRISRLSRLAQINGVTPPRIEEVTLPPVALGAARRPIPVIRVTFEEQDLFAPGSVAPSPQAKRLLNVMAENMHRDVPDIRVTVLGHTDASGTEVNNVALSQNRAQGVVQELVASGVNPGQLSAVAIGPAQPIAPNSQEAGRARNRRVEFLISPSEQANFAAVSMRPVNPAFLSVGISGGGTSGAAPTAHRQVRVLKPQSTGPADFSEAPEAQKRESAYLLAPSGAPLPVGEEFSGSPVVTVSATTANKPDDIGHVETTGLVPSPSARLTKALNVSP
jgi:outer membrane protein OmpA-like peptidoglycan-associated protein